MKQINSLGFLFLFFAFCSLYFCLHSVCKISHPKIFQQVNPSFNYMFFSKEQYEPVILHSFSL